MDCSHSDFGHVSKRTIQGLGQSYGVYSLVHGKKLLEAKIVRRIKISRQTNKVGKGRFYIGLTFFISKKKWGLSSRKKGLIIE